MNEQQWAEYQQARQGRYRQQGGATPRPRATSGRGPGVAPGAANAAHVTGNASRWRTIGNTNLEDYAANAVNYAGRHVPQGVKNVVAPVANAAQALGNTGVGQMVGKVGGFAARNAPAVAGAVELARRAPVGEMMQAGHGRQRADQQVANMTPQQRQWMQQYAPGAFQTPDYDEAFRNYDAYGKFYGGPNRWQNAADVINAPMNALTFGGWEMVGAKQGLDNMGRQIDQANQQAQQGDANYQRMQQQYQYQQRTPYPTSNQAPGRRVPAQMAWTPQQMQQHIQQKQQQLVGLSGNPAAAQQVQREIQWLQGLSGRQQAYA